MNKISVCIIVKNEQNYIENCIKSVLPVAWEIIILDTGSTDNTIEICRSVGDPAIKIYETQWENDFSKARNECISYATGDWILSIDADEVLTKETQKELLPFLNSYKRKNEPVVFFFRIKDIQRNTDPSVISFYRNTLFRNGFDIHYVSPVHEYLDCEKFKMLTEKTYSLTINHTGNLRPEKELKNKLNKYIEHLEELYQNSVDETDKISFGFYLANAYGGKNKLDDSIKIYLEVISIADRIKFEKTLLLYGNILRNLSFTLFKNKNYERSLIFIGELIKFFPGYFDAIFFKGLNFEHLGYYKDAIEIFLDILEQLENKKKHVNPYGLISLEEDLHVAVKYDLIRCYMLTGQEKQALELLFEMQKKYPGSIKVLGQLFKYYLLEGNLKESLKYYFLAEDISDSDKDYFYGIAESGSDSKIYRNTLIDLLSAMKKIDGWFKEDIEAMEKMIASLHQKNIFENEKITNDNLMECKRLYYLGLEYSLKAEHVKAIQYFYDSYEKYNESGLSTNTPFYAELIMLSITEFIFFEKYQESLYFIEELLEISPDFPDALFYKGLCFEKLGKHDEAQNIYKYTLGIFEKGQNLNPLEIISHEEEILPILKNKVVS